MNNLKTAGYIVADANYILGAGSTVDFAISTFNDTTGGASVRCGDGPNDWRALTADDFGGADCGDWQEFSLRPATASLLAKVYDCGGDLAWGEVRGIACTCEEEDIAKQARQIATGLSEFGRRALATFLAENLNDKALRSMVSAWEQDVTFDHQSGHLEIGGYYSDTGNPTTRVFDGDEVVLEEADDE